MNNADVKKQVVKNIISVAELMKETQPAIAGILYCVCGAINNNAELELYNHIKPFAENQIQKINNLKAQQN